MQTKDKEIATLKTRLAAIEKMLGLPNGLAPDIVAVLTGRAYGRAH